MYPHLPILLWRHMRTIILARHAYTPVGTFGYLHVGPISWYSLEEPWRGNRVGASCIPTGKYDLLPVLHNISTPGRADDYPAYEIADVENRTAIHIHIGNTIRDIAGCVLVGKRFGALEVEPGKRLPAVLESRKAFDEFMEQMGTGRARIAVVDEIDSEFIINWDTVSLDVG